jgi:glycerate kinase
MTAFLIAPNAFKGSLSATEAAKAIGRGIQKVDSSFIFKSIPLADGGDGTSRLLSKHIKAEWVDLETIDALGRPIIAGFGYHKENSLAIIDVAEASGIQHLSLNELNPKVATSYGTGLLIKKAIELGAKQIWLGLGGSASIDGGIGILEALGFNFFNLDKKRIENPVLEMDKIASISYPNEDSSQIAFTLLCDVENPLLGKNGSVAVFGLQKGVKSTEIIYFENRLRNWAKVIEPNADSDKLESFPKLGAAGGIAFGLQACLNTQLISGSEFFLKQVQFTNHLQWADVLITGEGKFDQQSSQGKITDKVIKEAQKYGAKVFVLVGNLSEEIDPSDFQNVQFIEIGKHHHNLQAAIENTAVDLENASYELALSLKSPQ